MRFIPNNVLSYLQFLKNVFHQVTAWRIKTLFVDVLVLCFIEFKCTRRRSMYQFDRPCFNPTGTRTHDLKHSRQARYLLHHWYGYINPISITLVEKKWPNTSHFTKLIDYSGSFQFLTSFLTPNIYIEYQNIKCLCTYWNKGDIFTKWAIF